MNNYKELYVNFSNDELLAERDKLQIAILNMEAIPDLIDKCNALNAEIQVRVDKKIARTTAELKKLKDTLVNG